MSAGERPINPSVDSALMVAGWSVSDIADELDGLAAPQLAELIPALSRLMARFEAVRLGALSAADRWRVGDLAGMGDTASWAAAATGEKRGRARHDCELAAKLRPMSTVASALADGALSKTQAATIADAHRPSAAEQADLVGAAAELSVTELERRVEQFNLDHHRPDEPIGPSVVITKIKGGVKADFTLDALGGEFVTTALDAAAGQLTFDKGTGLAQRRAAGLVAVSRYFLEHHDKVTHRLGRPHVVATVPLSVLGGEGGSALLASGAAIDAATARQLACDASISRLITGPAGEPLDVGRSTPVIPTAIARQLIVEDRRCRWVGCNAPAWSCDGHHVIWWDGPGRGETKLTNLVLLCWHHHHLLHKDPGWQLQLDAATRRLNISYRDRPIGATHPPGRQRAEPVCAPASSPRPTDTESDLSFDAAQLFDLVAGG